MSTKVMRAVDEHQVRAAAGTTMVLGAVAFAYAYFRQLYWPLQAVSAFFTLEFALRLTLGLRRSQRVAVENQTGRMEALVRFAPLPRGSISRAASRPVRNPE